MGNQGWETCLQDESLIQAATQRDEAQMVMRIAAGTGSVDFREYCKLLGLKALDTKTMAALQIRNAVRVHRFRGSNDWERERHNQACKLVQTFTSGLQLNFWRCAFGLVDTAPSTGSHASSSSQPLKTILAYSHEMDATEQKMRPIRLKLPDGSVGSQAPERLHIMMQSGMIRVWRKWADGERGEKWHQDIEPWLIKALAMGSGGSAEHVLGCLLQKIPVPLLDRDAMTAQLDQIGSMYMNLVEDRASTNFMSCRMLFAYCQRVFSPKLSLHMEPCNIHGGALVKARSDAGKKQCMGVSSFAKLTRDHRAGDALLRHVGLQVTPDRVRVVNGPITEAHKAWIQKVMLALFPRGQAEPVLYKKLKSGRVKRTRFHNELVAILSVVDVEALHRRMRDGEAGADAKMFLHYCYTDAEMSALSGINVGAPCCQTESGPSQKVRGACQSWICGRAWKCGVESRWLHIMELLIRFPWMGILTDPGPALQKHYVS